MIQTVAQQVRAEIDKIKGSRFFGTAYPASDLETAEELLREIRSEFPDATHHCWAWRGPHENELRYSDDHEPSGSAGRPIFNVIAGRDLSMVLVVVTRYYGGTKLGTGGLVRAYTKTAQATLDAAEIVQQKKMDRIRIQVDYPHLSALEKLLHAYQRTPIQQEYQSQISLTIELDPEQTESFMRELNDATCGAASQEKLEVD